MTAPAPEHGPVAPGTPGPPGRPGPARYLIPPVAVPGLGLALLPAAAGPGRPGWLLPEAAAVLVVTAVLLALCATALRRRFEELAESVRRQGEAGAGAELAAAAARARESAEDSERLRSELAHRAAHDQLTGLRHRAEAERMLAAALESARTGGNRLALLFVALESFRRCNELHGQLAGDHVLLAAAARLRALARGDFDEVFRVGSDEFAVLLTQPGSEPAVHALAARVVEAIGQPVLYEGMLLQVGARVGVAISVAGDLDPEIMFGSADRAAHRNRGAALPQA